MGNCGVNINQNLKRSLDLLKKVMLITLKSRVDKRVLHNYPWVLKGADPRRTRFRESTIRSELYQSFKVRKLHFYRIRCKPRRAPKTYSFKV